MIKLSKVKTVRTITITELAVLIGKANWAVPSPGILEVTGNVWLANIIADKPKYIKFNRLTAMAINREICLRDIK